MRTDDDPAYSRNAKGAVRVGFDIRAGHFSMKFLRGPASGKIFCLKKTTSKNLTIPIACCPVYRRLATIGPDSAIPAPSRWRAARSETTYAPWVPIRRKCLTAGRGEALKLLQNLLHPIDVIEPRYRYKSRVLQRTRWGSIFILLQLVNVPAYIQLSYTQLVSTTVNESPNSKG